MYRKNELRLSTNLKSIDKKITFIENFKFISNNNKKYIENNDSLRLAVNNFADIDQKEFLSSLTLSEYESFNNLEFAFNESAGIILPDFKDWRLLNALPPVKNQGSCGACWAFSAVDTLSSRYGLKYGKMTDYSPQFLVNCIPDCHGCKGCFPIKAFFFLMTYNAMEEQYCPYQMNEYRHHCCSNIISPFAVKVKKVNQMRAGDEVGLKLALESGPVSSLVAVNNIWQFYSSGVLAFGHCPANTPNHALVTVGYTPDFWIVRNSFGVHWGEGGYARISRNMNVCGILDNNVYPEV